MTEAGSNQSARPTTRRRYVVCYSCTPTSLKHEVEQHLLDGWQLEGGVSVSPVMGAPTERNMFAQALSRQEAS